MPGLQPREWLRSALTAITLFAALACALGALGGVVIACVLSFEGGAGPQGVPFLREPRMIVGLVRIGVCIAWGVTLAGLHTATLKIEQNIVRTLGLSIIVGTAPALCGVVVAGFGAYRYWAVLIPGDSMLFAGFMCGMPILPAVALMAQGALYWLMTRRPDLTLTSAVVGAVHPRTA